VVFLVGAGLMSFAEQDFMDRDLGWDVWPSGLALGPHGWGQVVVFVLFDTTWHGGLHAAGYGGMMLTLLVSLVLIYPGLVRSSTPAQWGLAPLALRLARDRSPIDS
jgi:hypothetical protein